MRTIEIFGVPHAYELTPNPETKDTSVVLVFIHGWLLSKNYWKPLIEILSSDYQCLSYDLRGFGDSWQSSQLNREYNLEAYAQDLKELLEKLKIEKVWLVGHSLGGIVGLWSAHYFPEKVEGVICLNSGGGIYLKEEFERFRSFGMKLVKFRPSWLWRLPIMELLFARIMVKKTLSRSWGKQRLLDFIRADEKAAIGSLLDSTKEEEVHSLAQLVAKLPQPVYFLAGLQDKVMEPKYVRHLASFHSSFEQIGKNVIEIPNCGHLSMLEQPNIVQAKIAEILNLHT